MSVEPCPYCERPDNPAITNWVTGHIFVGWGHGWQPCQHCGGTAIHPQYGEAIEWLVWLLKQLVPFAAFDQGAQLRAERDALIVRRDELLVTIKNLSLSTPYAEEATSASTLIAEVGTLKSKLREVEEENARLRARLSGRDPRSLDE